MHLYCVFAKMSCDLHHEVTGVQMLLTISRLRIFTSHCELSKCSAALQESNALLTGANCKVQLCVHACPVRESVCVHWLKRPVGRRVQRFGSLAVNAAGKIITLWGETF